MTPSIRADAERLVRTLKEGRLDELGFTNVCVEGINQDKPMHPYAAVCLYTTEPTYRVLAIGPEASNLTGAEVIRRILGYTIRPDYLRRHQAIVREFVTVDTSRGTLGEFVSWELAYAKSHTLGLPIAFFLHCRFAEDETHAVHLWFPEHLMPDEVLGKFKELIRVRQFRQTN